MTKHVGRHRSKALDITNARIKLKELGHDPMERLVELETMAIEAFKSGRGWGDKVDAGPQYLQVALQANIAMLKTVYATIQAIAVKDLNEQKQSRVMNTMEAINVLKNDPMSPQSIKDTSTDAIIKALESETKKPKLPIGSANE